MNGKSDAAVTQVPLAAQSANWYALYTASRHEKSVASHLRLRGIEFFLPLYAVNRRWRDGSRVTLQLPLFPSYIFIRIGRADRRCALSIPGAVSIVGGLGHEDAVIPDSEMSLLQTGLAQRRAEPHSVCVAGQRVRIVSGALTGFEGVIVRNKNNFRVVLTLDVIARSISVEVGADEIAPLECQPASDFSLKGAGYGRLLAS